MFAIIRMINFEQKLLKTSFMESIEILESINQSKTIVETLHHFLNEILRQNWDCCYLMNCKYFESIFFLKDPLMKFG